MALPTSVRYVSVWIWLHLLPLEPLLDTTDIVAEDLNVCIKVVGQSQDVGGVGNEMTTRWIIRTPLAWNRGISALFPWGGARRRAELQPLELGQLIKISRY